MTVVELRVLDGPNLYFTQPAIKLTLGVALWLALPDERAQLLVKRAGFTRLASPGAPNSDQRRRYIARFVVHLTRLLADATATQLAIRGRAGPEAEQIVIAFVWRRQRAAEAFARELAPLLEVCLDGRRSLERAIAAACRPWLDAEIAVVKPRLLVLLGATAAQALLGRDFRVSLQRGQFIERPGLPLTMATVHPSSILRAPDDESRELEMRAFVQDLKRLAQRLQR